MPVDEHRIRVLVTKVGLDGHDRGAKIVARVLRDAGMEVIYLGLRQTPETIAAAAAQEDADVVGLSMHNGAHLVLAPAVIRALQDAGLRTRVVVGGIVPPVDVAVLLAAGVDRVLGPGTPAAAVVAAVRHAGLRAPCAGEQDPVSLVG